MGNVRIKEIVDIEIGEPFWARNLLIYPLKGPSDELSALTIDEMLENNLGEILDSGDVSSAIIDYRGNEPMFILDGEAIVGALQNRVFNTAIWFESSKRTTVPVSCIEEFRWSGSRVFASSGISVYPKLRATLASSVTHSVKVTGRFHSNQKVVWSSVGYKLSSMRVDSPTRSLHDAFTALGGEIERYVEEIDIADDVIGIAAFAGGEFLSVDIFRSNELMRKFKDKLVRGFALDAIELSSKQTSLTGDEELKKIMDHIRSAEFEVFKGAVDGSDLRYIGDELVAAGLTDSSNRLLHLSIFPKVD